MVVCQFFLRGTCKFGDSCRNEHPQQRSSGFGTSSTGAFGNSSWSAAGSPQSNATKQVAFTTESITKDLTPMVDKPMWPLSSYGAAKYEPNVISGQEESSEELRVRAVMALRAGNAMEYQKYEAERIAAVDQLFASALANAGQVFQQAYDRSGGGEAAAGTISSPSAFGKTSAFGAFANSGNGPSVFGNTSNPTSAFGSALTTTPSAFGSAPSTTPSAFGQTSQPAFGQSAFGQQPRPQTASVFGQPSTGTTSVFGQPSSPAQSSSVFGQSSQPQSAFIKPATTGAFGSPTGTGGGFSAFAGNNANLKPNANASAGNSGSVFGSGATGAFGSPSTTTTTRGTGGGFSAFAKAGTSAFGSPTSGPSTASPSVFGQPAFGTTSAPTSAFGSTIPAPATTEPTSVFGASTTKASSPFGAQGGGNAGSVFGGGSGSAFGAGNNNTSAFGQPTTTSAFSSNNSPSVFGSSSIAPSQSQPQPQSQPNPLSVFGTPSTNTGPSAFAPSAFSSASAIPSSKPKTLGRPDFQAALANYKPKPGQDKYDDLLPPNYIDMLPAVAREAFESVKFEWGKAIPDFVPPVQLR